MRNKIGFFFFFVSLLASIGLFSAPAQAAASDCPSGYFCIWTGTGYSGSRYQWSESTLIDSYHNGIRLGTGINNRGYSFYNHLTHTNMKVMIFDNGTCADSGWYRTMVIGQMANASGSDWGGRVSSIQLWNAFPLGC